MIDELEQPQLPSSNISSGPKPESFISIYGTPLSIIFGALLIGASIYFSNGGGGTIAGRVETSPSVPGTLGRVNVSADNDPFIGDSNAPVTIIEFSDFQCPFCRNLWRDTLPRIKEKYVNSEKVKFVYRDFPLDIHAMAQKSAEAAECANEQGKFWQYHDKVFAEQDKLGPGTIKYTLDDLKIWSKDLGLDSGRFENCLDSGKYAKEVSDDLQAGLAAGVDGTPGSFVNGRFIKGALPYGQFEAIIEEELKNK